MFPGVSPSCTTDHRRLPGIAATVTFAVPEAAPLVAEIVVVPFETVARTPKVLTVAT
jgi:hypothetical protein